MTYTLKRKYFQDSYEMHRFCDWMKQVHPETHPETVVRHPKMWVEWEVKNRG